MNLEPQIYKIGISMTRGMTCEAVERLLESGISLQDFFLLSSDELSRATGMNPRMTPTIGLREEALERAREEYRFVCDHHIHILFYGDEDYPEGIAQLADAPVVLYALGDLSALQRQHTLSVVGTRRPSKYGLDFCYDTIACLGAALPDLLVVSGLAYGIDCCAHKAAMDIDASTVGIVAHGLDMIYPAAHRQLARDIVRGGGLILSEYPRGEKPLRGHFLARNRLIAAMSAGTLVVESDVKGGAMSTAATAFDLDRELMALPGRAGDTMSAGCNALIRRGRASLVTSVNEIADTMNWSLSMERVKQIVQPVLFSLASSQECTTVLEALKKASEPLPFDILLSRTGMAAPALMSTLSDLECDGHILRLPGNRYSPK